MVRNRKGFTLIEVIVVAGIIAVLAGILVPMIFSQIDESKKSRALGDCKALQSAIMSFKKDTGVWPVRSNNVTADVTLLVGNVPPTFPPAELAGLGFDLTKLTLVMDHLSTDKNGSYGTVWKGPYLTVADPDPWGNAYIINAKNFNDNPSTPVWILSPGPDGVYSTPAGNETLVNDDIGIRIK